MLKHTFLHVPGVGPKTELKLWEKGIFCWEDFVTELRNYSVIVTYNGKCFDLPFIRSEFKDFRFTQAHIDLRYFLYRLGYSGGLKRVEANVGIQREKGLQDIDGYLATVLWRKYLAGDARALQALIRYNIEDVVNLKYLMEFGYNRIIEFFPIPIDYLKPEKKIKIDVPFDPGIVQEIRDELVT